jgi:hypothetical protein
MQPQASDLWCSIPLHPHSVRMEGSLIAEYPILDTLLPRSDGSKKTAVEYPIPFAKDANDLFFM